MKKAVRFILIVQLLGLGLELIGQTDFKGREFALRHDNDVYTFRDSDKYYSNGFIFFYRWVPKKRSDSIKVIREFEIGHKTYTPKFLFLSNVNRFDRPYAGTFSALYAINRYPKIHTHFRYGVDVTLVGPASGADGFQEWYHELFDFPLPSGWQYQIPNELTVNLHGLYQRQVKLSQKALDMVSETSAIVGTGFINARQFVDFRFGRLQNLLFSAHANSLIGAGSARAIRQSYLFAGIGLEYVAHNITVQGSLFNDKAPHTEQVIPWVRHMRMGAAFSGHRSTFKITYHWVGPEVKEVSWNSYVSFELQLRFPSASKKAG